MTCLARSAARSPDVPSRRRLHRTAVALAVGGVLLGAAPAAAAPRDPRTTSVEETRRARDEGARLATELATLTGVSLSPLLGMSVLGAVRWLRADPQRRPALPWHQQPWFWASGLAVIVATFLGDKIPIFRHLVKHLKLLESKLSGLLAAPVLASAVAGVAGEAVMDALRGVASLAAPSAAADAGDVAAGIAAGGGEVVAFVAALGVAFVVWLAGHAVDVLVLLSPFAPLDAALRLGRLAVIGAVVAAVRASPVAGLAVAAVTTLVALLVAGWSFRLMVLGSVFSWDVILGRSREPSPRGVAAFAGAALRGVRRRTYGRLVREDGVLVFAHRPWLVLRRRRVPAPAPVAVAEGLLSPVLLSDGAGPALTVARFPPRYRGWAPELARALGDVPLREPALVRGLGDALGWLRRA